MPELRLEGLGEPVLAQYLAALGVFRAVAEQHDAEATLSWAGGIPRIHSTLDAEAWVEWVFRCWRPSPIASPWNRGAGFYGSSKAALCTDKQKRNGVELVLATTDTRLDGFRVVLQWLNDKLAEWSYADAPDKEQKARKAELLARLRAEAPDDWLPWLDAATVLEPSESGPPEPKYLALLGSGGNDGRLDLGNNYMLHLCNAVGFQGNLIKRAKNADQIFAVLLRGLLGEPVEGMLNDTAGQLAPSSRSAPNGVSGTKSFSADEQLNPWLFLWAVEGTLLFSGASTRRLGSHGRARAAFPFHADRIDAGYGTAASSEKGKDELWLPMWDGELSFRETRHLFGEARAQVGRRRAQSGLDYARAIGGLATTRGVDRFLRFAIVERAGQSNIAVHVGTFASGRAKPLDRLRRLDAYLQGYRRLARGKNVPARFTTAWRGFEEAVLEVARRGDDPTRVTALLASLGRLRREEAGGLPDDYKLPKLSLGSDAEGWVDDCDRSPELMLAASVATLDSSGPLGSLRAYLWPSDPDARLTTRDACRVGLVDLLGSILERRLLEHRDPAIGSPPHRPTGGRSRIRVEHLLAFLDGTTDDERILDLIWWFSGSDAVALAKRLPVPPREAVPAELSRTWMLARLALEGAIPSRDRWLAVRPAHDVVHALRADQGRVVVQRATHVLRAAGLPPRPLVPPRLGGVGQRHRLAAALVIPLPTALLESFAEELLPAYSTSTSLETP